MNAIILAKTIASNNLLLESKGEITAYIRRLYKYKIFTVAEICEFSGMSEYLVRQAISGEEEFRARAGIATRHLDHLVRMISDPAFAKIHTKSLLNDGVSIASLARVTGLAERSLRRWAK